MGYESAGASMGRPERIVACRVLAAGRCSEGMTRPPPTLEEYGCVIDRLLSYDIEFILCGGFAVALHGEVPITREIGILHDTDLDSIGGLSKVLGEVGAVRRAPPGMPIGPSMLMGTHYWELRTAGPDLHVASGIGRGGWTYLAVKPHSHGLTWKDRRLPIVERTKLLELVAERDELRELGVS